MGYKEVFEKLERNPQHVYDDAVKILCKIADNILKAPSDLKKRTLQKSNATISSKVLSVKGGAECLKLMGFSENDTCFTMATNVPLNSVEEFKKSVVEWRKLVDQRSQTIEKVNNTTTLPSVSAVENKLKETVIKKIVLPPLILTFSNPFLRRIETYSHSVLQYEDSHLQERTRKIIPVAILEENAQKRLRIIQEHIKKNKLDDPDLSIQDTMILELLRWFKEEFFEWVDSPSCESCGNETSFSHMSTDRNHLQYTDRVELHRCKTCSKLTPFPRYNDLNILLETRRGRCGEWANTFTLCCRSMGWDSRFVLDETDHVWTEVFSVTQNRWLHCDPCENACDTPLMYESGWGKKVSYVIAYSCDDVQDVTWRYSSCHKAVLERRKLCGEKELLDGLLELRGRVQKGVSEARRKYLARRVVMELVEFLTEKKPNSEENKGRSSGSEMWRLARGEIQEESKSSSYVWRINPADVSDGTVTIRYSSSLDKYECISGNRILGEVSGWDRGAYAQSGVFKKVEKDWKMTYLARKEGVENGSISWKFDIASANKKLQTLSIKFDHKIYENGIVDFTICAGDSCVSLPKGEMKAVFENFSGCSSLCLKANLSGGKGDVAWQHAQLFRQSTDSKDYTFAVTLTFKENVVSNSSFLSDGWCISILGKPCANLKIYADAKPEDRQADNIGNLFTSHEKSRENLDVSRTASEIDNSRPYRVSIANPEVRTSLEEHQTPHRENSEALRVTAANPEVETSREENRTSLGKVFSPEHSIDGAEQSTPAVVERPITTPNLEKRSSPVIEEPSRTESPIEVPKNAQALYNRRIETENKNQVRKIVERKEELTNKSSVPISIKAEHRLGTEDGTVIYIGCNRSRRHSKSNNKKESRRQRNNCCDENCQTSRPSILKPTATARSDSSRGDPSPGKRHQKTSTGTMDAYPVKETATRAQNDRQQTVLTSDKILQTSDDRICFFRCGRDTASNTEQTKLAESYVNTFNTESTKMQTSENTWASPDENRCWYCSKERERVCSCAFPGCKSRLVERHISFSSLNTSPRTPESCPSEIRRPLHRKKSPKISNKFVDTSEESARYICVPPCEGFKKRPSEARRFRETNPRPRSPPRNIQARVVPCDGRCRRTMNPEPHQNYCSLPFRPPPPPIPRDFSSSDEQEEEEEDEETDIDEENEDLDGFTSDGSRIHRDLPYQNNDEYLELVQELEETLQNRNRNRVKRAMKEFENKSRYNRPLEQPIINYEEPSESEEPIIRRISELNEKRISRCQGDCCGCRKEDQPTFQLKLKRPTSKPNKSKKFSGGDRQARWQMDNKSGEWFKVGENDPPKFRNAPKLVTPRGRLNELPCGCSCSCGK
ncbi:unnamed protein product [Phaedon cochleariae]|uniref:Peptide-N(4)-(N-acetyl-beta-glucosaminyl)asparagine amidase n=1 Tax=Phaedon cochleariae TaxID=80249 RepID=A0A9P0DTW4_PHACE|nr:unnamed protein product [Phaedon cochleariae]